MTKNAGKTQGAALRTQSRARAERISRRALVRLIACTSLLRTVLTGVLPLAGSASWWLVPALIAPGALLHLIFCILMRKMRAMTLTELALKALGRVGGWAVSYLFALTLALDGAMSLTALICLFTEGIGTAGTQMTVTLLTCGVLAACLHEDGLPRGVYLLRWCILFTLSVMAADLATKARLDGLFPIFGGGASAIRTAVRAGAGMSWPLLLLLTEPPVKENTSHARELPGPVLLCLIFTWILTLAVPHTTLVTQTGLAQGLLIPVKELHPAVRTLALCVMMLTLFLLTAGEVRCAAQQALAPLPRPYPWLPYALTVLLALTQWLPTDALWQALRAAHGWLLMPFAVLLVAVFAASLGRKERKHA